MNKNNHILEGSITKGVIYLATPIIFSMVFQSLFNIVDAFWLGKISAVALAAVAVSWPLIFFIIALAAGIAVGCNALVARYYGAKDFLAVKRIAQSSLTLGILVAAFLTIVGVLIAPAFFKFMGAKDELLELTVVYSNIIFYGTIVLMFLFVFGAILRGEGDTKTPMKLGIGVNVINIILDPIFIFSFGWGVAGAAWATVLSNTVGLIYYFGFFKYNRPEILEHCRRFCFDLKMIKDLIFIGFPASLTNVANAIGIFFITKIVAAHGAAVVAAYGIGFRIESFFILPIVGIASATQTMVGQNYGANNLDRAKKSGWISTGLSVVAMSGIAFIIFILASHFVRVFNNEPAVIEAGASLLKIRAPAFIFASIITIVSFTFQAFGKAHYSLLAIGLRVTAMVGLAYWFNGLWGYTGVWWAIAVSSFVLGIVMLIWYKIFQPPPLKKEGNLL